MSDPFFSCKYTLAHARRHMASLKSELDVLYASDPFKRVVEQVPGSDFDLHKIRLEKPLPEPLSGITFDTLNNLRSSLDQACHAIGKANGTNGNKSHFPFGDTPAEVESRFIARSSTIGIRPRSSYKAIQKRQRSPLVTKQTMQLTEARDRGPHSYRNKWRHQPSFSLRGNGHPILSSSMGPST
jgi:hypothetical protein